MDSSIAAGFALIVPNAPAVRAVSAHAEAVAVSAAAAAVIETVVAFAVAVQIS